MESYAQEKLGLAADALKGRGPKKEKLRRVANRTLSAVSAEDFPTELRSRFEEIQSALTQKGKIGETIDAMTEQEASEVAGKIVELQRIVGT